MRGLNSKKLRLCDRQAAASVHTAALGDELPPPYPSPSSRPAHIVYHNRGVWESARSISSTGLRRWNALIWVGVSWFIELSPNEPVVRARKNFAQGRDGGPQLAPKRVSGVLETANSATAPRQASEVQSCSADQCAGAEISGSAGLRGGPDRIRTAISGRIKIRRCFPGKSWRFGRARRRDFSPMSCGLRNMQLRQGFLLPLCLHPSDFCGSTENVAMASADHILFARTDFRSDDRIFGIKTEDRMSHVYVIGKTGTGKSTLLETMVLQDIVSGAGIAVIDPHGDLVEQLLPRYLTAPMT